MTGVFTPEFKVASKTGNYLANNNRLSVSIVAATGRRCSIRCGRWDMSCVKRSRAETSRRSNRWREAGSG